MKTFAVFLRGINVSGSKPVKMALLREQLQEEGFENVRTYIQSGNICLDTTLSRQILEGRIETFFRQKYGYSVPVIARTAEQLDRLLQSCPYHERSDTETKRLYYALLQTAVDAGVYDKLNRGKRDSEEFTIGDRIVYLYLPEGYGRAKLSIGFLEKVFGMPVTIRNRNTLEKMLDLATSR